MHRTVDRQAVKQEHLPRPKKQALELWYRAAQHASVHLYDWPEVIRCLIAEVRRLRDAQDEKG